MGDWDGVMIGNLRATCILRNVFFGWAEQTAKKLLFSTSEPKLAEELGYSIGAEGLQQQSDWALTRVIYLLLLAEPAGALRKKLAKS